MMEALGTQMDPLKNGMGKIAFDGIQFMGKLEGSCLNRIKLSMQAPEKIRVI